ncbi:MAG: DNA polymerase III subunit delta [Elusimicrobia bacterium RIFCSPLOWO2_02_FULL_39_32]|nr:MAG: DNA polymerase III subunit delta [Elusimicrobia bacterium GWA2_38_7]OGR79538.1 MAG: DNA polymerase III subunit delta [Elusimicrobia bacterium RIFCSPHIGHO2_02_FULL_39_36]OGR92864.1 MAG: DNA polymerase III subunit delta [Elusimicrobia bacterium RIFCSPLOWO2_02_FULL_39_32]OGR99649.1 MAG: DNA polymerase III subunit delta [Elusimicrobia bacterium RIFCSPLOWO2_12_FULL_39_28]
MPSIDSSQFFKTLKNLPDLPSILLFIGEEETLIEECMKATEKKFFSSNGNESLEFNFEKLDGGKDDGQKMFDSCSTLPLHSKKKLVLVSHFEKSSQSTKNAVKEYSKSPNPNTCLTLLHQSKLNSQILNCEWIEGISVNGMVVTCWKLFKNKRQEWIKQETEKLGMQISLEASQLLSEKGGESLLELKSEIEKAALYSFDKNKIEVEDIKKTLSFKKNEMIWELKNLLEKGELKKAGWLLEQCLDQKEEPIRILHQIAQGARAHLKKTNLRKSLRFLRKIKQTDLKLKTGEEIESGIFEQLLLSCKELI